MLALSRSDLRQLITMREAIDLMKVAFQELSYGRAASPLRTVIDVHEHNGVTLLMPGYVPAAKALGVKVVSVFTGNRARNIPTIHALVTLIDYETGVPIGIMDGAFLTALRTGAVSGAATELGARPDSRTLVVIGAGAQGITQAAAVCTVRPIDRVIAVDVFPESLARFKESAERDWPILAGKIETATDAASVVGLADVICTSTTSKLPVFSDADLKPGVHINGVGAYTPAMQEIPSATVARALVTVDNTEAAYAEAGDMINPVAEGLVTIEHYSRELGHVVAGDRAWRTSPDQVTFFKSVGNAVQDVVVARHALDRARERGVGVTLNLD